MSLMTLTPNMSVGVKSLDEDHVKLVEMLNKLHEGILAGHSREALGGVLDELVRYTKFHFAREEEFFEKVGYAGAAAHKQEHSELMKKATDLQARYKSGSTSMLSLETMAFLKSWLSHHILEVDKQYGPQLKAKGIR